MEAESAPAGEELTQKLVSADVAEAGDGTRDAEDSPAPERDAVTSESDNNEEESEEEWETESLYEDALQTVDDEQLLDGVPDACTLEEALYFRKRLRAIGQVAFVEETIGRGVITAKKLCTAFGIAPPPFLEGAPDKAYYPLLGMAISREISKRLKLPDYNTVDDAVELLKKSKNIMVITGAGISTSLGIPDFRSKDIGLYAKLQHLGLNDPQEVFDISLFHEDPSIFFSVAKEVLPTETRFSPTHAFIRLLQDKGKLLTNFTQNIDNLESYAGILPEKLIQCHGSFATATCVKCKHKVPGERIFDFVRKGQVPECEACKDRLATCSNGMKRKRSSNGLQKKDRKDRLSDESSDEDYDIPTPGVMKPDITFFGEDLPDEFHRRLIEHDRNLVDLVIVIGTSLKVAPVGEIPGLLRPEIPQIYISRTPVSHIEFDVDLIGDCDVVVSELCRRAGWELQHEMIPEDEKVEIVTDERFKWRHTFTAVKK
ncbi:hypothetical protein VTO42DRAFT_4212 [Malbranchea cinnamomea]